MKYLMNELEIFIIDGEDNIVIRDKNNVFDSIIQYKEENPFFVYKKKKYYLKDLTPVTLKTLKDKQKNNQYISPFEIEQVVNQEEKFKIKERVADEIYISELKSTEENGLEKHFIYKKSEKSDIIEVENISLDNIFKVNPLGLSMLFRLNMATIL